MTGRLPATGAPPNAWREDPGSGPNQRESLFLTCTGGAERERLKVAQETRVVALIPVLRTLDSRFCDIYRLPPSALPWDGKTPARSLCSSPRGTGQTAGVSFVSAAWREASVFVCARLEEGAESGGPADGGCLGVRSRGHCQLVVAMQKLGSGIKAVGPYHRSGLVIDANLPEVLGIAQGLPERPVKQEGTIDIALNAVLEPNPQAVTVERLDAGDSEHHSSIMLGQRRDRRQRLQCLGAHPVIRELIGMEACPLSSRRCSPNRAR